MSQCPFFFENHSFMFCLSSHKAHVVDQECSGRVVGPIAQKEKSDSCPDIGCEIKGTCSCTHGTTVRDPTRPARGWVGVQKRSKKQIRRPRSGGHTELCIRAESRVHTIFERKRGATCGYRYILVKLTRARRNGTGTTEPGHPHTRTGKGKDVIHTREHVVCGRRR